MKVRQVQISRFRGIKSLTWDLGGDFVCLIGPGDSTKTTILDAIELALSPRWNLTFYDTDFHDASTQEPISIIVTIGEIPEEFKSDAKYGYAVRGWTKTGELHDEPEDDDELVLSIRLLVDSSLEPSWAVINERNPEGLRIGAKDRERLGCLRLGDYVDRHFSWARGSVLSRLTSGEDSLPNVLAEAGRTARMAVGKLEPEHIQNLHAAAEKAGEVGAELGVPSHEGFRAQLDVLAVSVGLGGFSLHDGEVPLRMAGLGTRRLLAAAMQREATKSGGVTLLDEVEHALEPHRIRRLLRVLRDTEGSHSRGHVIMTTHAPVVLEELNAADLRVVRSRDGVTEMLRVEETLQPVVRKASEALLARKVLVCEGKTELGLCRYLDQWWSASGSSFGLAGIALVDGNGEEAPSVANGLAGLGYAVALLGDSDKPLVPEREELEKNGVYVIQWADGKTLEERVLADLPWQGVLQVVRLAMEQWGEDRIRDATQGRLSAPSGTLSSNPQEWCESEFEEGVLRNAIASAAKDHKVNGRKGWFKRVDLAEQLACVVVANWDGVVDTDFAQKIAQVKAWAHEDG